MSIQKQFVKVLFPFQYRNENDLEAAKILSANNKEKPVFQKIGFDKVPLRKGLSDLFCKGENKSKIVDCFQMNHNSRMEFDLPKRQTEFLDFYCRGKDITTPYKVAISDVTLYLFESEIGFAEMECIYQISEISDYLNCSYFLTEIKSENNYFTTEIKVGKDETTTVKFTIKELLSKILGYITEVKDFYSGLEWEKNKEKGIVYSYLWLDENPDDITELLFNLRMNYKESYKFPQRYDTLNEDPAVLRQFENSYWSASYNGAVNVSYMVEDVHTNKFFEENFYSKMKAEYFVLFLAALHQRFVILKLMWEMGELDKLDLDFEVMKKQLMLARKYQAEAANLKFRDFFKLPSNVQHVNDYYELLYKTFCIDELYADFSEDLKSIEEICKVYVEKINKREEQIKKCRKDKIEIFVSLVGMLIGIVNLLKQAMSIGRDFFGLSTDTITVPIIIITVVLWIPSSMVVINAINKAKEIRKFNKEIKKKKTKI